MAIDYDLTPVATYGHLAVLPSTGAPGRRFYVTSRHPMYGEGESSTLFLEKSLEDGEWYVYQLFFDPVRWSREQVDSLLAGLEWCDDFYMADYALHFKYGFKLKQTASFRWTLECGIYLVDIKKDRFYQWEYTVFGPHGEKIFNRRNFVARHTALDDFIRWEFETLGESVTASMMDNHITRLEDLIMEQFAKDHRGGDDYHFLHDSTWKARYLVSFTYPLHQQHGSGWSLTKFKYGRQTENWHSPGLIHQLVKAARWIARDIIWNGFEEDFGFPPFGKAEHDHACHIS